MGEGEQKRIICTWIEMGGLCRRGLFVLGRVTWGGGGIFARRRNGGVFARMGDWEDLCKEGVWEFWLVEGMGDLTPLYCPTDSL